MTRVTPIAVRSRTLGESENPYGYWPKWPFALLSNDLNYNPR
jgi:hypothetical protein